jgi:hypothetical protein
MQPIRVTLFTAPGCHFCDATLQMLEQLGESFPISVDLMPIGSQAGRGIVVQHRIPFPPVLLLNGSFFGYGRISRRKLEQRLIEISGLKATR